MAQIYLSLVIPIYKVEKYLDRCLQSIVCQMDSNLEVILVDDGSPDKCPDICDEYVLKYSNFRVIHKKNGGLADAVKVGTLASTGEHIAYVDSDDWLENGWYKTMLNVLSQYPNIDVIMYGFQRVENDKEIKTVPYDLLKEGYCTGDVLEKIKTTYMKKGGIGPTRWNKIYSKKIAFKCLEYYDTNISIGEDMVFSALATDMMKDIYVIKKCFVNYYINNGSMTQHFDERYEKSFEKLFQTLLLYFGDKSILYFINYINMRTLINAIGKSDYPEKEKYLKKIINSNVDRIRKVHDSDLKVVDRIIKRLMIHKKISLLLKIGALYRKLQ